MDLQGTKIKDFDDHDDSSGGPGGVGRGQDDLDDNKPPPDPGEDPDLADIELSGDEGPGELDGSEPIDAIGDKILDRAGRSALDMMPPLPPPATPPPGVSDGRRSLDEVGPSGRLFPKGLRRTRRDHQNLEGEEAST